LPAVDGQPVQHHADLHGDLGERRLQHLSPRSAAL
jgi:hypothetical protein